MVSWYLKFLTTVWTFWLNGWVFVYELSGCGFESHCSHLNFRFCACIEQWVPWHPGSYRVWIHSEMCMWHSKNIQSDNLLCQLKGFVRYIFASLFCMSKREDLWSKEKCFLFHFESSFHYWDNQFLTFQISKRHDVIKCLSMKHEIHINE